MREYEVVREIKNSCPNNQTFELSAEPGRGGAMTIYALVDGMTEKFVFTPI